MNSLTFSIEMSLLIRMPNNRLPRREMSSVGVGWKKVSGSQTKTWYQSMKLLTIGLTHDNSYKQSG